MAIPVYLWLKDDGGADIKGSVDVQDREGSIEVVAQEHNLYIPTDNNTGKLTGTRIHTPFLFTKEIDSSSPYLYKAVTTGQTLKSAEFKWYKINDAGQEVEYFNTRLENVKVVKRHVIEICPFRVWELVLHHQKDYSLANAINLGGGACLAYADDNVFDEQSITRFFISQCQDLKQLPKFHKGSNTYNALVCDVPYSDRYNPPVFMDTSKNTGGSSSDAGSTPKNNCTTGKADGDIQLYYVYNSDKVIVSWRGTASLYDVGTDLSFAPVNTQTCNADKTECAELLSAGKVHDGFWSGYNRVSKKFESEMDELDKIIKISDLFICGHSLGGLWH